MIWNLCPISIIFFRVSFYNMIKVNCCRSTKLYRFVILLNLLNLCFVCNTDLLNDLPDLLIYLNEVFELACPNKLRTRNSYLKLICPFRKSNMRQNALSFIGPSIWNKAPEVLIKTNSINTFKHNLK